MAVFADTFTRTEVGTANLGTADTGGAWTATRAGTSTLLADGSRAASIHTAANTNRAALLSVSMVDSESLWTFRSSAIDLAQEFYFSARVQTSTDTEALYGHVIITTAELVAVNFKKHVAGTETLVTGSTNVNHGTAWQANTDWQCRFRVVQGAGSNKTLSIKIWRVSDGEPAAWTKEQTTTEGTDNAGGPGFRCFGAVGLTMYVDNLTEVDFLVDAAATNASGTGAASNASETLKPNAGNSAGTGAASGITASLKASAASIAATGAAANAGGTASASIGASTGTGAAANAPAKVVPNAAATTGTGAALQPTVETTVAATEAAAGHAAATGAAANAPAYLQLNAAAGVGTGAAASTSSAVKVNIIIGQLYDSGETYDGDMPYGGGLIGTGTAASALPSLRVMPGVGTGTGQAAFGVSSSLALNMPDVAAGASAAYDVDPLAASPPDAATGTGTAFVVTSAVAPTMGVAAATGAANNATANVSANTSAAAIIATATGAAANLTAKVALTSGAAAGTGTGYVPNQTVLAATGNAAGTGSAAGIGANVASLMGAATGAGAASNLTTAILVAPELIIGLGESFETVGPTVLVPVEVAAGVGEAYTAGVLTLVPYAGEAVLAYQSASGGLTYVSGGGALTYRGR